jgi:hypothetical protein
MVDRCSTTARGGYSTAISLNNSAITMIETGCYSQARDTLLDSIIAMKASFQTVFTEAGGVDGVSPQGAMSSHCFLDLILRRASNRTQFPETLVTGDVLHLQMLVRSLEYGYSLTPVLSHLNEGASPTSFHPIRIDPVLGECSRQQLQLQREQEQEQHHSPRGAWPAPLFSIERECHTAILLYNFGLANLMLSKVTKIASASARLLKCALTILQVASVVVGRVVDETHPNQAVDATKEFDLLQLAALILHATIQVHVDSSDYYRASSVYECYEYVRGALYESSQGRANDPRWWHLVGTGAPAPAA